MLFNGRIIFEFGFLDSAFSFTLFCFKYIYLTYIGTNSMSLLILTYNIGHHDTSPWCIPIWVHLNMTTVLNVSYNFFSIFDPVEISHGSMSCQTLQSSKEGKLKVSLFGK